MQYGLAVVNGKFRSNSKQDYERVRRSGETNMADPRKVAELTGMNKERIIIIQRNYDELKAFFT